MPGWPSVMKHLEEIMPQDRMMQFFEYKHLPANLAEISRPFADMAARIVNSLPANPERTVALRKLLEAKDCAVRAWLYEEPKDERT